MIESIAVKNFQSLYDVTVPLSPFTVIVGKSSSGKSAFIRACRLLLQNARGTGFISHGEHTTIVSAQFGKDVVMIQRGKTNAYTLVGPDIPAAQYTKLGGEVPDEVQEFLGIDPSLSIAAQFDPPFLLTASGSEVARTLGGLTNVDLVLNASREANRRKLAAGSDLRALEGALAADKDALEALGDVQGRLEAVERAEQALQVWGDFDREAQEAHLLHQEVERTLLGFHSIKVPHIPAGLEELFTAAQEAVDEHYGAEMLLQEVDEDLRRLQEAESSTLKNFTGDLDGTLEIFTAVEEAEDLLEALKGDLKNFRAESDAVKIFTNDVERLQEEYQEFLVEMSICPTCGQSTEHLGSHG